MDYLAEKGKAFDPDAEYYMLDYIEKENEFWSRNPWLSPCELKEMIYDLDMREVADLRVASEEWLSQPTYSYNLLLGCWEADGSTNRLRAVGARYEDVAELVSGKTSLGWKRGETKEEWRERFFTQNDFDFWMPDDGAANPNLGSEGGITLGALIEERKRVEAMNAAERERLGV